MSRSASSSHVLVKCASLGGAAWSFHSHRGLSLVSSFLFFLWPFLFTLFRKLSQLLEYHICRSHIDSLGKNIALNCPQQWAMSMVCGVALWLSLFCRNTWYSFLNCTYYPDVCNVTLTDSHICDQRNNLSVGSFFFKYLLLCNHMYLSEERPAQRRRCTQRSESLYLPGAGVNSSCKPLSMGVGN